MSFKIKKPLLKFLLPKSPRKYEEQFVEAVIQEDMDLLRKVTREKIKVLAPILWNNEYVFPIHIGCALGSRDVVKFLFRIGCILETKTEDGRSPLHFSATHNATHPEVTGHLLDMGAKTNVKDKNRGYTPLHCACESNNYGAAKKLLEVITRFVVDNNGKTAKDLAIENDSERIVALFEAKDEENRKKEALMSLPGRIEQLERQTEFLLRHGSMHSGINDSGLDNSNDTTDFHNQSPNLISLHTDHQNSANRHRSFNFDNTYDTSRQRNMSGSTHSVHTAGTTGLSLRRGSMPPLISLHDLSAYANYQSHGPSGFIQGGGVRPLVPQQLHTEQANYSSHFSHISPIQKSPDDSPLTRDSALGRIQRHQVVRNYSFLHSMMKPEKVIIKLFSKDHLDMETKEKLSKMPTQQDKNDFILHNNVLKGSMGLYEDFLQSLRDSNQEHIAERLNRVSESPLYSSSRLELSIHKESTV